MDRRRFLLTSLAGALAAPLAAGAQQAGRPYRIGVLDIVKVSSNEANLSAFRQGLRELGHVEGQNFVIEYRSADGLADRFPDLASELVRLKVDVIVTRGTPAALAAKHATGTIPIVMVASGDPVGVGLVPDLARPVGNVTGLSSIISELAGKRLELLRAAFPSFSRVALLWNPGNPAAANDHRATEAAVRAFGAMPSSLAVRRSEDFGPAFEAAKKQHVDVIVVISDGLMHNHRRHIVELAKQYRLPAVYAAREFVETGGLMCYGVSYPDMYSQAAIYVDKILKGAKPADLPVAEPTKFELVINLKTAKALGLTIPPSLLARADQVIQ
jgi:putative tryptophan/tyrosine transport system substrate-binding protein